MFKQICRAEKALTVPLRLSMIACLLLVGSGCVTVKKEERMRHIVPPEDSLELKAASPTRYLKNIKVVNGQGETIAEGQVGQTMGSIPIEKLDPSTTIIHTYIVMGSPKHSTSRLAQ